MNHLSTILVVGAYFFGAMPFGILIGKKACRIDVRKHGAGNSGVVNVLRLLGKKWGCVVILADIFKGWLPVFLILRLTDSQTLPVLVATAVILGHTFSLFLKGRGGKSVATGFGTIVAMMPATAIVTLIVFALVLKRTAKLSRASLVSVSTLCLLSILLRKPALVVAFVTLSTALIFFAHRSNLRSWVDERKRARSKQWENYIETDSDAVN